MFQPKMMKLLNVPQLRELDGGFATMLSCADRRFEEHERRLKSLLQITGVANVDPITVFGGVLGLVKGSTAKREAILEDFEKSIRIHGSGQILLSTHRDCQDHGGSRVFDTFTRESDECRSSLAEGRQRVLTHFPTVRVRCFLFEFKGIYELSFSDGDVASAILDPILMMAPALSVSVSA